MNYSTFNVSDGSAERKNSAFRFTACNTFSNAPKMILTLILTRSWDQKRRFSITTEGARMIRKPIRITLGSDAESAENPYVVRLPDRLIL